MRKLRGLRVTKDKHDRALDADREAMVEFIFERRFSRLEYDDVEEIERSVANGIRFEVALTSAADQDEIPEQKREAFHTEITEGLLMLQQLRQCSPEELRAMFDEQTRLKR